MRRLLLAADLVGLVTAFAISEQLYGSRGSPDTLSFGTEIFLFSATLPLWAIGAKLFGLYDADEERADHSTSDEIARVLLLVTLAVFVVTRVVVISGHAEPDPVKETVFWGLAILAITVARIGVRTAARKTRRYVQRTVVVGTGELGQTIARKLLHHPEYGIDLIGLVGPPAAGSPRLIEHLRPVGDVADIARVARELALDRVIVADTDTNADGDELVAQLRELRNAGVQVDIVPWMYQLIGPKLSVHSVEGLSVLGLPPVKLARSSRAIKRAVDIAGASVVLVVLSPLLAAIAVAIRLDSRGPVLFRQRRLGKGMKEFTMLKFRTMSSSAPEAEHREYIGELMRSGMDASAEGLFKLDRSDVVTRVGRRLRKHSLDELPQLINVLRGDMSLVGPRPCIAYETEWFEPHHFDRFLVPAGMTGFWQVTARAHATFGEALDLDVLYARSSSLGLDLALLARTPLQLVRSRNTA